MQQNENSAPKQGKFNSLVGPILDALKDSTDRLQGIWQNTGSMGAEAQIERNVKIIQTIDTSFKPDASRRPNVTGEPSRKKA